MPEKMMQTKEPAAADQPQAEYTVQEILDELMNDPSWEEDPVYRRRALGFIHMELFTAS